MSSAQARIDYLVPDYDRPSWGVALLYEHVRLLRELGYDARVLHQRTGFRLGWIERDAPIAYLDALDRDPSPRDLLIVPEVLAAAAARLPFRWRRGVFVQGSFLIAQGLEGAATYPALGYRFALAVLPHVAAIVERYFGLPAAVTPPFIAPYFFRDPDTIRRRPRQRLILFAMKPEYRAAGMPDYDVFMRLVRARLEPAHAGAAWRLLELDGLRHTEVAELMAEAAFLVNLNSHEAFNTTVPEAMAAGCVPICYDAFGGRDFLADGDNAFVFPNHHVFPLVEKTLALVDADRGVGGDAEGDREIAEMRLRARATAGRFTVEHTRAALERVYAGLVEAAPARGGA